ncbi:ABC transporter ATP-binding protein [Oleidesulfovibrio sp.]|uniref:ABC transporter ATP-binding protein n=1 Tax=Oleidesulfovibrio sp. TaxID=2909707 RepID=UPI003A8424A9
MTHAQKGMLIRTRGLYRTFRQGDLTVEAVRPLDLEISQGEFVALQGASGSGKSTLLHILGLLDRPTGGSYHLQERDVSTMSDDELSDYRNRLTGFVFQNFYLIPYSTALDNVLMPGLYSDIPLRTLRQRAVMLLEQVGLGDRMTFKPSSLSGGQQQRVALARALLLDPALILADEPTGQLDSATSADILDLFGKINELGKTIVMVTHDKETAARARRRIVFRDGQIESEQVR